MMSNDEVHSFLMPRYRRPKEEGVKKILFLQVLAREAEQYDT
jgi:hypothetical protein